MEEDVLLLVYKQVLENIEGGENHLLIANGFNRGLGINTGYPAIFQRMAENNRGVYHEAMPMMEECCFDLEALIGKLENDIADHNQFLKKYVRNKVKFDFMQATHEIVKSEIKNIYAEKNEGVFLLLRNFDSYFSLNYDSFLYLFLLKHKSLKSGEKNAIAFQPTIQFIEEDIDASQNDIYTEIKEARTNGTLKVTLGEDASMEKRLCNVTKSHFVKEVTEYSKTYKKGWKTKDITRVVDAIFEEEKRNALIERVDDGSRPIQQSLFSGGTEFVFDPKSKTQNIFFLHGAFHIYKDGDRVKKITQQSDKALYQRLEEVINDDQKEIVCVLQHTNKTDAINDNDYLMNCLNKLGELKGSLVIIGCSLSDNDDHIFEKINNSEIKTIYLSTLSKEKSKNYKLARKKFPSKEIYLFDAESISYELIEEKILCPA
ncbi:MAG: DUF4917 family protein [Alistipes sp.]|nr:DUF4917 family protein [Alistipes sp.]